MTEMTDLDVDQLVRRLLAKRGLDSKEAQDRFLNPDYSLDLHDPFLLTDMEAAVERIIMAVNFKESIVVYGDYDIDGLTASAVMLEAIRLIGGEATSYIPDRFEEGYGLNLGALKYLQGAGTSLVISVDCGVTSVTEADWARAHGLDLIITDHHAVPDVLPNAIAVVNPKRPGDLYPFKDLAGVGVAFKVLQAVQIKTGLPAAGQEKWLLDLVALGTVCDVVSLIGENRALAAFGLQVMRKSRRVGLQALADVGGVKLSDLTSYHLGFVLGPRMNAAGRLEHAAKSLELIQTARPEQASDIAAELDSLNSRRRSDQELIFNQANRQAEQFRDDPFLVVADPNWSHGIVGIVASKLVEKWRKPTLVLQIIGDATKGSARSIGSYDLIAGFRSVSDIFSKFGGHYFAAGCTLPTEKIDELRLRLNEHIKSLKLPIETAQYAKSDLEITDLGLINWPLWEQLQALEPHGNANPRPMFETGNLKLLGTKLLGRDNKHYRLKLETEGKQVIEAVAFGMAEAMPNLDVAPRVRIWYHLGRNDWQGKSSLQLLVAHLELD